MLSENKIVFCDKKELAGELWRTCFPSDSPDFVSFYMNRVHKPGNSLVLTGQDGEGKAYLDMIPYEISVGGETIPASYLSGVCTLPEYRGRGYMTAMLRRAFRVMYDRGDVFSVLIPAKQGLYEKFGFCDCFFLEEKSLPAGEGDGWKTDSDFDFRMDTLYRRYCKEHYASFLLRSEEQWKILLEEHVRFENGEVWKNGGAYALVSRRKGKTVVKEAMGKADTVASLLRCIGGGVILSPDSAKPFGQARVLNVLKAMRLMPDCRFCVQDSWIPENNGVFEVCGGVVRKTEGNAEKIGIEKLTSLILKGKNYMNLMLN